MNYLEILDDILKNSGEVYDSVTLINKDGVIEYTKRTTTLFDMLPFEKNMIGSHIFDAYTELNEENSNTMQTLKTGKICKVDRQVLTSGNISVTLASTTYPIFDESGQLQGVVDATRYLEYKKLCETSENEDVEALHGIISENDKVKKMKDILPNIARNSSSVFLYGETGTGKELFAQALHLLSERKSQTFIVQNCAAIPENLMESTFFGTETGGFTGAEKKQGLFELANHGTLFLDEVNSMSVHMQAKLLTALEEKKLRRIGGQKDIPFDVRIICASNEEPWELIRQGRMREDFYYRISVVKMEIPPLRERPEDIMPLSDYFIDFYNKKMKRNIQGLSDMVKDVFLHWSWPGNVRELRSTIESAFNMEKGRIISLNSISELLEKQIKQQTAERKTVEKGILHQMPAKEELTDLDAALRAYETMLIEDALLCSRTCREAAEKLCISPQKLNYRMKVLEINTAKR